MVFFGFPAWASAVRGLQKRPSAPKLKIFAAEENFCLSGLGTKLGSGVRLWWFGVSGLGFRV